LPARGVASPNGKYLTVGNPIKLSDSISEVTRSPLLGEHTDEILRDVLGYTDNEMSEIKTSGALTAPEKGERIGSVIPNVNKANVGPKGLKRRQGKTIKE